MNRSTNHVVLASAFTLGLALSPATAQHHGHGDAHADHHSDKEALSPTALPECPVMGEPINLVVSTSTDEGPVFFCCKRCIAKYQSDPTKYAAKVVRQRKALAGRPKIQVTCPVSHEPADQDIFVESGGTKVFFCCKSCVTKYQGNPDKYAAALANSYTYQTKCPVMGEDVDPQAFTTTANGANIYFCCKGCDKKFLKNPQKYVPKLVAQGFTFDEKELIRGADERDDHGHDDHGHGDHEHGDHDQ